MNAKEKKQLSEFLENTFGHPITNLLDYDDGFGFTVDTEAQAYKAAYMYRYAKRGTTVRYAPNVEKWSVQVYTKELTK